MRGVGIVVIGLAAGCNAVFGLDPNELDQDVPDPDACAFEPIAELAAGATPFALAAGDLDNDGAPDLVVASRTDAVVTVFYAHGDGTFAAGVGLPTTGEPRGLGMGELRRDGLVDLAVCTTSPLATAYLADRPGMFERRDLGIQPDPAAMAIANLDAMHLDLLVASRMNDRVEVLAGDGDGNFTPAAAIPTGDAPSALAVGDLDGDHRADLVIANTGGATLSLVLSSRPATLQAPLAIAVGPGPGPIAVGDLDGDGDLDLAVLHVAAATVSVAANRGDGTFEVGRSVEVGGAPSGLAIARVDDDEQADLVVGEGDAAAIGIYLGDGELGFTASTSLGLGARPVALELADFDRDDHVDLAVATDGGPVRVFRACRGPSSDVL